MVNYFFDNYAVVEIISGNPNYSRFVDEKPTLTIFNLAEIYWSAINNLSEENDHAGGTWLITHP